MFKKNYYLLAVFCLIFFFKAVYAKENKILIKVNNEIITSIDILNEIRYLSIINEEFKSTENNLKLKIAKNSLIREKIKNIELQKYNQKNKISENMLEDILKKYFANLNINSIQEFELFFKKRELSPSLIKKKIKTELMWNQLIYDKFIEKVKINQEQIAQSISNKKKVKEYLLSEILINAENNEELNRQLKSITQTISEKNFTQAALTYSVSETARNGGKLGWIKESVLSNKIKKKLSIIKIGQLTQPITIPGGFLILKIEDIREVENKIDLDKEIKNIINKKTNKQLNSYSNIYFNKLKKNIKINEI